MTNVTSIYEREFTYILDQFADFALVRIDERELDRLYRIWIPLLSTYVTHDSIEAAIDDWYTMVKQPDIWLDYIDEAKKKAGRPFVVQTLEKWKKPFVFAGRRVENDAYLHWVGSKEWQLAEPQHPYFIGLALPSIEQATARLVHAFEADDDLFHLLEAGFEESSCASRQLYLNQFYLSCLSFLSDNQ